MQFTGLLRNKCEMNRRPEFAADLRRKNSSSHNKVKCCLSNLLIQVLNQQKNGWFYPVACSGDCIGSMLYLTDNQTISVSRRSR